MLRQRPNLAPGGVLWNKLKDDSCFWDASGGVWMKFWWGSVFYLRWSTGCQPPSSHPNLTARRAPRPAIRPYSYMFACKPSCWVSKDMLREHLLAQNSCLFLSLTGAPYVTMQAPGTHPTLFTQLFYYYRKHPGPLQSLGLLPLVFKTIISCESVITP